MPCLVSKDTALFGTEAFKDFIKVCYVFQDEWTYMHELMSAGMKQQWVQPHVSRVYSMHEAPQAHCDIMNTKSALGKIILKIDK